jgi:hypothetical protein
MQPSEQPARLNRKEYVNVDIETYYDYTVDDIVKALRTAEKKMREKGCIRCTFNFDADDSNLYVKAYAERPETDAEYQERYSQIKQAKERQLERDLAAYERLKTSLGL